MPQKAVVFDVPSGETAEEKKEADQEEKLARAPLFAALEDAEGIDSIVIERLAPIREGTLGKMEPEITEEDIAARWGGGKFRVWARNARGKQITNRTIEIAGEPIFASEISRAQYRRMVGGSPDQAAPAPTGAPVPSWQEILAIQAAADERRREDYERRVADQEKAHQRELERMHMEQEFRRKESEEREERRRKEAEETRQRDREFQAVMMQIAQASGAGKADPVQTLLQGFQLGQQVGGGGEPGDPMTALAANLPAILDRAGTLLPGAARPPAQAEQVPATQGPQRPDQITFGGPIGQKARRVVEHLRNQGVEPEAALDQAFNMLLATRRQTAPAETPPAPAVNRGRFTRKTEPAGPAPEAAPATAATGR